MIGDPMPINPEVDAIPRCCGPGPGIARDIPLTPPRWRLEDIDFTAVQRTPGDEDDPLLLVLMASSFVESGTHLYASNLIAHFAGDREVATWLAEVWEPEELQHGQALRSYVAHVWPSFDWERAYARFIGNYGTLCTMAKLESRRGLEMAARCVVETGTTSLYRAIQDRAREPVLRSLMRRISADEIGHYRHFYRYFRNYQQQERNSRAAVLGALIRRSLEISREDTDLGLRYAYAERYLDATGTRPVFDDVKRAAYASLRTSAPVELSGAMWLRPLQLDPWIERQVRRLFSLAARTRAVPGMKGKLTEMRSPCCRPTIKND